MKCRITPELKFYLAVSLVTLQRHLRQMVVHIAFLINAVYLFSLAVLTMSTRRLLESSNILFIVLAVLIPRSFVALIVMQYYNGLTANGLIM